MRNNNRDFIVNIMKGIKVLLAVALIFVMCGCCSFARGEKLLTLEEIWQDGATWQEVMSCGDEFTFLIIISTGRLSMMEKHI